MLRERVNIAYTYAKKLDQDSENMSVSRADITTQQVSSNTVKSRLIKTDDTSKFNLIQSCNSEMVIKAVNTVPNITQLVTNEASDSVIILCNMLGIDVKDVITNPPNTHWNDKTFVTNWLVKHSVVPYSWEFTNDTDVVDLLTQYYEPWFKKFNENADETITNIMNTLEISAQAYQSNEFSYDVVDIRNHSNVTFKMTNDNIVKIGAALGTYCKQNNNATNNTDAQHTSAVSTKISNDLEFSIANVVSTYIGELGPIHVKWSNNALNVVEYDKNNGIADIDGPNVTIYYQNYPYIVNVHITLKDGAPHCTTTDMKWSNATFDPTQISKNGFILYDRIVTYNVSNGKLTLYDNPSSNSYHIENSKFKTCYVNIMNKDSSKIIAMYGNKFVEPTKENKLELVMPTKLDENKLRKQEIQIRTALGLSYDDLLINDNAEMVIKIIAVVCVVVSLIMLGYILYNNVIKKKSKYPNTVADIGNDEVV